MPLGAFLRIREWECWSGSVRCSIEFWDKHMQGEALPSSSNHPHVSGTVAEIEKANDVLVGHHNFQGKLQFIFPALGRDQDSLLEKINELGSAFRSYDPSEHQEEEQQFLSQMERYIKD